MNSRVASLPAPAARQLPALLLLFAGSGCAALIYEIVWFQMLELVVGSAAISMAVVLGTFMGGMGLGNLVLPRLVRADRHPLRIYALLEFGIAVSALFVWFALPAVGHLYAQSLGPGRLDYFWRTAVCVIFLLPPTIAMGATLPVIARWTRTTPQGVSWLGACYGINIAGAVAGCLLAGFFLLRIYDLRVASAAAVTLNIFVALVALALARSAPEWKTPGDNLATADDPASPRPALAGVHLSIALSGFCALVAQVIWTRLLSLMLGGTVYTFSIILAVFLSGLGLGGFVGAILVRRVARPGHALGWCQLAQVLAIAWADDLLTRTLPFWPSGDANDVGMWGRFLSDLLRCSYAILPATLVWGASFPLAIAAGARSSPDPGRSVGRVYAANTIGAVLGAVLASIALLPALGTSRIETLLFAASGIAALALVRPASRSGWTMLTLSVALAVWLGAKPSVVPWQLVAYGRHAAEGDQTAQMLYIGEGNQATVAVSQNYAGIRYYHVSGKTEASSNFHDMRVQRMLGHLPALLHPEPHTVLVVGCGAGVTTGSLVLHPSIKRVVLCEIEPLVAQHVAGFF
ncbi:MAG TPA: fused MFS/spermidine synthase, partial [Candidatus Didemnitutus sp.]|nr:fused MFS/spermidine synthase [Candidatus Didemnitutus sp.]